MPSLEARIRELYRRVPLGDHQVIQAACELGLHLRDDAGSFRDPADVAAQLKRKIASPRWAPGIPDEKPAVNNVEWLTSLPEQRRNEVLARVRQRVEERIKAAKQAGRAVPATPEGSLTLDGWAHEEIEKERRG